MELLIYRHRAMLMPLLVVFAIPAADGAGLGEYEVQSSLGQPLRMVVQITVQAGESIDVGCFKINPHAVGNDGLPQLAVARLRLDRRGNQQRLIVSSARPIQDPIIRVSIDIGCNTALRRDLTLLLDPAPAVEALAEIVMPAIPAGVAIAPAERPATTPAPDGSERAAPAGGTGAGVAERPTAEPAAMVQAGRGTAPRPRRQQSAARASKGAAKPRPSGARKPVDLQARDQTRLRLSKTAAQQPRGRLSISTSRTSFESYDGAPITPRLTLSTTIASFGSQPPLPEAVLSDLRQKLARLKAAPFDKDIPSLEAELVVLQKQTTEMRNQLDAAMARTALLRKPTGGGSVPAMRPAIGESAAAAIRTGALPAGTPASGWDWRDPRFVITVTLGAGILLLILGIVIWLRRERMDSDSAASRNEMSYVPPAAPSPAAPEQQPALFETNLAPEPEESATVPAKSPAVPESSAFSTGDEATELGVSDLAQATEKANVFVTLGRPEQAVDVLRDHIDHEPKPSPMAWLMLLDLYRKSDRHSEFVDVAQRFHREFNAEIPAWDQHSPSDSEGLAAFPHLIRRIRDDWARPEARAYIEELLHDNQGGLRIGFSLPAFRDLLLLHSIIEGYLAALEGPPRTHRQTGAVLPPPSPPAPPPHLAEIWEQVMVTRPEFPEQTPRQPAASIVTDPSDWKLN